MLLRDGLDVMDVMGRQIRWRSDSGKIKRSQPSAAPTEVGVGAAEGCDLLRSNH
jgi:hypothetical protein